MSRSEALFPYLGDHPAQVTRLSEQLADIEQSLALVGEAVTDTRTQLRQTWVETAADLCDSDIGVLATGLPALAQRLVAARTSVDEHQVVLAAGRRDVDDIRVRYDHQLARYEQASSALSGLIGSTASADFAKADAHKSAMTSANSAMSLIDADYRALAVRCNTSAQTCSAALTASWNGGGQSAGAGAGSALLAQGGMGSGSFRVLHLTRMQQLAAQAEDELKGINEVTLLPEERSARLEDVLDKYGRYADDPDFATALSTSLGQDYFRELPGELGDYQHFWGGGQDGNEDYQLDSRLFAMSAAVLAAATDSEATSHVSADWIADLTHDDRGGVQPGWVVTATDYLRTGVQFPPSYLDAVGQSAIDWERSRPDGSGDPWQGYGNERFNGAEPLSDPPIGRPDPLGAVLDQYSARPDPTSALFTGGPIDPATGRSADPAAGNLMWLLHRSWEGDGADQLGDLLDVMSNPGPNGDPQAAGDVAYNVLTAVALGDDGLGRWLPQGMPSELPGEIRDSVANITARYMGSIIGEAGGQPATGGLFPSGIPGESSVARVDFGQPPDVSMYGDTVPNTSVARALTWLYQDTDNTDVRETLYAGWLTSSGVGAADGLHEAELANATGDSAAYHREVLELRAHTAASAQVFGLLTQTDVNSFGASDAEAAAKVEEMRSGTKTIVVVGKEIVGATGLPGRILSAGIGIFNNMLIDDVIGTHEGIASDHHNMVNQASAGALTHLSSATVTSLSQLGLPVISELNPSTGVAVGQTATVDTAAVPDAALFTEPDGRLLAYDDIYAAGPGSAERIEAFERWCQGTALFGDTSSLLDYEGEVRDGYNAGLDRAQY